MYDMYVYLPYARLVESTQHVSVSPLAKVVLVAHIGGVGFPVTHALQGAGKLTGTGKLGSSEIQGL